MFITLAQLVSWVQENWIHPVHSAGAQDHIRRKLSEEVRELIEALESGDHTAIGDEAGDVAWCVMAIVINASVGSLPVVDWDSLVVGAGVTTLADIDRWALEWIHPWSSPKALRLHDYCNVDLPSSWHTSRHIRERNLTVLTAVLMALSSELGYASSKYRTHATHYAGTFRTAEFGRRALEAMAQMLLLLSLVTQTWAAQGLGVTMERTMSKQLGRLAAGRPITTDKGITT
jgi:phosphoribosyl-ATP pyrophosphohydrolase